MTTTSNRLESIATRNKKSLAADIVLAALLALGLTVSALVATGDIGATDAAHAIAQAAPIRG